MNKLNNIHSRQLSDIIFDIVKEEFQQEGSLGLREYEIINRIVDLKLKASPDYLSYTEADIKSIEYVEHGRIQPNVTKKLTYLVKKDWLEKNALNKYVISDEGVRILQKYQERQKSLASFNSIGN